MLHKANIKKLANLARDWRLGISTRGTAATTRAGGVFYASVNYDDTIEVLRRLELRPSDVFIDVGAGKGRVLCLAAQNPLRKAIGIECSPDLVAVARENLRTLKNRKAPAEIFFQPAEEFDYSSATALYFFNPFEAEILDIVLRKIESDRRGRPLRLAFVMESPAQRQVFAAHTWLERYANWIDGSGHPVTFYRAR